MSQILGENSIKLLENVKHEGKISPYSFIKRYYKSESYRKIYTQIYQLEKRSYLERYIHKDMEFLRLSAKGLSTISTFRKEKDGKWKMIIFDIPEEKRKIRDYLRSKLKQLGFKRWQNSIWVTPYKLPDEVVKELKILSEKYFVRLITVDAINNERDLKAMF